MISFKFSSSGYGGDFIVIAKDISEAMIEVAHLIEKQEGVSITVLTIEKQRQEVHLAPSVMAQLEVEALTK